MPASEYRQWLKRGRSHQGNGRAIEAMLCFRRAQRADPRASDASFHLGEVLWKLGRVPDAIAAWRDAARANGDHLAPNLALAEALLAASDLGGAVGAADAALRIAPDDPRAAIIATLARLLRGELDEHGAAIFEVLERDRDWLEGSAVSGSVASALDRFPDLPRRSEFLAMLGRVPASLARADPRLLAVVIEAETGRRADSGMLASLSAAARDRTYQRDGYEALRRIAAAIARFDPVIGAELRGRYAALCVEAFTPDVPLGWPIRSAGRRMRIVVLLHPALVDSAACSLAMHSTSPSPRWVEQQCRWQTWCARRALRFPSCRALSGLQLPRRSRRAISTCWWTS